jgi:hypothetical protein
MQTLNLTTAKNLDAVIALGAMQRGDKVRIDGTIYTLKDAEVDKFDDITYLLHSTYTTVEVVVTTSDYVGMHYVEIASTNGMTLLLGDNM